MSADKEKNLLEAMSELLVCILIGCCFSFYLTVITCTLLFIVPININDEIPEDNREVIVFPLDNLEGVEDGMLFHGYCNFSSSN